MSRYSLDIVQQPIRSRLCGFGEKDRRPIDPPPVVKARAYETHSDGSETELPEKDIIPHHLLVQVEIFDSRGLESCAYVYNSTTATQAANTTQASLTSDKPIRNLLGSLTAEGTRLRDTENNQGIFFCFQDLSVRVEGVFTLRFSLVDIEAWVQSCVFVCRLTNSRLISGKNNQSIVTQETSDAFQVYSPKKFPGMTSSTALSKTDIQCFASQGIKISIRKVSRRAHFARSLNVLPGRTKPWIWRQG
ncbi:hypothetical protein E3Q11_00488 [Wallemia mellicola]|nr:hypothetical protein E3Q11_00488 [Wallemia mellicola]